MSRKDKSGRPNSNPLVGLKRPSVIYAPVNKIIQSKSDKREYKLFTLPNQMKVLLIADPAAEKSAAALDVNAGTGHEPKEFQGLAHFTEHMLFQGTKKYPSLTDYNDYISDHAGSRRAFTDFMNTNYHFDISNDHF